MEISQEKLSAYKNLNNMSINLSSESFTYDIVWCDAIYSNVNCFNKVDHIHSFWEIQIVIKGSSVYEYSGEKYTADEGSFLIFPPFTEHRIVSQSEDMLKLALGIKIYGKGEEEKRFLKKLQLCAAEQCIYPCSEEIKKSIFEMLDNVTTMEIGYRDIICLGLQSAVLHIFRVIKNSKNIVFSEKTVSSKKIRHEQIRSFIVDNASRRFGMQAVADQFHMSTKQVDRIMIKYYGKSAAKIKREIQIEIVKDNLRKSDLSLPEIALQAGFCDEFSMSRAFKAAVGIPPAKYRESFVKA